MSRQPLTNTLKCHAEETADRWTNKLLSNPSPSAASWYQEIHGTVQTTARAAFTLYAISWGPDYDIREWQWPFDALMDTKARTYERPERPFDGRAPWCILLSHAVKLAVPRDKAND